MLDRYNGHTPTNKANTMFSKLLALFTKRTQAQRYMAEARRLIGVARADKADGCPCAARAAVGAALAYRAAFHAERFYAAKTSK